MAGRVVVGPAIRKAIAAAGFMPCVSKPLIIGSAVKLLVYAGTPRIADVMMANGFAGPNAPIIHSLGT